MNYDFDEFAKHPEEIHELLEDGREPGKFQFERSVIRSSEYFKEHYSDEQERMYKFGRFCLIMHYISTHMGDFDQGDFAVVGSARVGSLVSDHLLKAVHQIFTTNDLDKLGRGPTPEQVLELADKLRENEEPVRTS